MSSLARSSPQHKLQCWHPAAGRYLGQTRPRDTTCRRVREVNYTHAEHLNGTLHVQLTTLHNSIRRPESTPRRYAPKCFKPSSSVPNVHPRIQVTSSYPTAEELTQYRSPAERSLRPKKPPQIKCVCTLLVKHEAHYPGTVFALYPDNVDTGCVLGVSREMTPGNRWPWKKYTPMG